ENSAQEEVCEKLKRDLQLLTSKRGIFVLNINERGLAPAGASPQFQKFLNSFSFPSIILSAREELDSAEFGDEERKEVGLGPAKLPELIRLAYETLGLITFFTTGEDETRAWTIKKGTLAPQAAGVIHTDFEKKFICADVIFWSALLEAGSWSEAKTKGMVQTVGKEYDIKDGDVIEVKHGA
ncbi:MAG: DUF933 domain-containing protein, partial [Candidatus Spechtbacteria bacterium]|nr:DUF933 domain-containing protein [Candidatus Spechtbacteria bacterium]